MEKKGQTLGLTLLTSLFVLITGMLMLNFLLPSIDDARVALNCSNANAITDGTKILCLATDGTVPYWIIIIFSLIIGGIAARFTL